MTYSIEIGGKIAIKGLTLEQATKRVVIYSSKFTVGAVLASEAGKEEIRLRNVEARDSIRMIEET
jgi:hypothetical protein